MRVQNSAKITENQQYKSGNYMLTLQPHVRQLCIQLGAQLNEWHPWHPSRTARNSCADIGGICSGQRINCANETMRFSKIRVLAAAGRKRAVKNLPFYWVQWATMAAETHAMHERFK